MTSFAHQLRQALLTTFDSSVGPVLLDLEAKANDQEHAAAAATWEKRHAAAVAEARRQEHRAALLATALGDVLRNFPQRDRSKPDWEDRRVASRLVYRDDLARWGQLIPSARRGRDWRRNTVLRTKRDATNNERNAAQAAAHKAQAVARDAVELHRQELTARSEAEIGWRAAVAELKALKAERNDAPQRIVGLEQLLARTRDEAAELDATLDRSMAAHGEMIRRHASAVRQARKEHARGERLAAEVEQLRAELADVRLASSEQQGQEQRDRDQWARESVAKIYAYFGTPGTLGTYGDGGRKAAELFAPPLILAEFGTSPRLCGGTIDGVLARPIGPCVLAAGHQGEHQAADGSKWALTIHTSPLPAPAIPGWGLIAGLPSAFEGPIALASRANAAQAAAARPCWCGHQVDRHITDDGDNAICRDCWNGGNFHQAFHVHTPEQP